MDAIAELCGLLERQKEKLVEYEQATLALLDCPPDDAEYYIMRRGEIANEIDALGEEMGRLCDSQPGGKVLMQTAFAKIDFDKVPSEYHCVFYSGQAVRSVGSRILESEKQVMARLETLRDEAREYIRQNQNLPKIKKYLTDLTESSGAEPVVRGKA